MLRCACLLPSFVVACALLGAPLAPGQLAPQPPADSPTTADAVAQGLTRSDWAAIRAAFDASRHAAYATEAGLRMRNPGQRWQTEFDGRGFVSLPEGDGWRWGLELTAYGFAGQQRSVGESAHVSSAGQRVAYDWDDTLQEWFVNDLRGLEHGFVLGERPCVAEPADGPLIVSLAVRGDLAARVDANGRDVSFVDDAGVARVAYTGLSVVDATGRLLPAWFESLGERLLLKVDEAGAAYPVTIDPVAQQAYLKASNTAEADTFGISIAVSGDTVIVGAEGEDGGVAGVNGDQSSNSAEVSGAAYVFVRSGATWTQQAYLKASNPEPFDRFGASVAISGDTAVVGAWLEDSGSVGVNGNQASNAVLSSGAAYVFVREAGSWSQQAYLKASNTGADDWFGKSVVVSGDTLAVAAYHESSSSPGVGGNQGNNAALNAGAVYVFTRSGTSWSQQAYLKASNPNASDWFGISLALSGDTIVVGAMGEDSNATGIDGDQNDNSLNRVGAAYVFARDGATWSQQAYLKSSNTPLNFEDFGLSVAVSGDTVVVGAIGEDSAATGVDGDASDDSAMNSGAAYVFTRSGTTWSQQAYLKASNTGVGDAFGGSVALSGNALCVGAGSESLIGNTLGQAGAAYVFTRVGGRWSELAYLNASNPGSNNRYGSSVAISGDVLAVACVGDDSAATGVNGNQSDTSASGSGAAFAYDLDLLPDAWTSVGVGLAGVSGVPLLSGAGTLIGGDVLSLALVDARPSSSAALLIGLSQLNVPFKGGTLVPAPDILVAGLPTDVNGRLTITAQWPVGLPSGVSFWVQEWITDAAGPAGFSASNGLAAFVP